MTMRAALAFFIAASAAAQVRENVTVNLIEVPVTVIDGRGNPVRGLTKANFEILDQGEKQPITSFEVVDFAAPLPATAISPLNPAARRSFLLLFDLAFTGPNAIVRAQEAARRFVRQSLQPRDLVAVAVIDQDRGCRLLSSFTTDRELIATAIDSPTTFRSVDPLGISNQTRSFIAELEQPGLKSFDEAAIPTGHAYAAAAHELDMAVGMQRTNEGLVRQRVERHVDALGELAAILSAVRGRKQVLLLSEGVPAKILLGRDAHSSKEELDQAERIIRGTWASSGARMGDADTDRRFGSTATQTLLDRMARRFNRNDVVLHALDLQGARMQNDTFEGEVVNSNKGLAALARSTGGDIFENSNRLGDDFARLLHQQEVVYVLGFQTSSASAGAFHDLKVKVSGAGRVRVSNRAGYIAGASSPDRPLTDAEIVIDDVPQPEIRMATLAAPIPAAGERAAVPLILDFNGEDLLRGVAVADAEAQLFVYAFDEAGLVRDRFVDRMVLHVAAVGDDLRRNNLRYFATLALPPGKYAIKALVRVPQTGRKGYARTDVEVPHPGEVAILPPLSVGASGAVLVRGMSHAAGVAFPFHINGEPFMPGALVAVQKGVPNRFALFIYNAPADDVRLDATVTDAQGRTRAFTPPIVARLQGDNVSKIVFEYANADSDAVRLDIIVHSSRLAAERLVSVPLEIR